MSGFAQDLVPERILYEFGFTHNSMGKANKMIPALRFIIMAGSAVSGQNSGIQTRRALRAHEQHHFPAEFTRTRLPVADRPGR